MEEWERRGGHRVDEVRGDRKYTVVNDNSLTCDVCNKICRSKAGLTIHRKRMHEKSSQKKIFTCDRCLGNFSQDANLRNHMKSCTGMRALDPDKKTCDICNKTYSRANFKRHYDTHLDRQENLQENLVARVYKVKNGPCPLCGTILALTNLSRHQKGGRCTGGAAVL